MLTVSAEPPRELPEATAHPARCSRVLDLGTPQPAPPGVTPRRKVLLSWQLLERQSNGEPFHVHRRFTLSLSERSALRPFLESWRGRKFSDAEAAGFDLAALAGKAAMLSIVHTERAGRVFADVAAIATCPRQMTPPELDEAPIVFDIDDGENAEAVLAQLPEKLQEAIRGTPEWQSRGKPPSVAQPIGVADEDIPF